jgi:tetratricopeptide (TPR) repeat protein
VTKTSVVAPLCALAMVAILAGPATAASQAAGTPAGQKVVADPVEHAAYMAAFNTKDPAQKAAAMEAFAMQYPGSVVKVDALEQAMAAYQAAGNQAKVEQVATTILRFAPGNLRAMAVLAFLRRTQGTAAAAAQARAFGEEGLLALPSWSSPPGMAPEQFANLRKQLTVIFAGACGFGALQAKDYAAARDCYERSLQVDPRNMLDTYQLGAAELQMTPLDVRGFWYVARALTLARGNEAALKLIEPYGRATYAKYHGSEDGWDALVAAAATQTTPPADFTVTPAKLLSPAPGRWFLH